MTICAIATAKGVGGIAVVRVSGTQALAVCDTLLSSSAKTKVSEQKPRVAVLRQLYYTNGDMLDEAVVTVFRAPHSFTGEDVVEIAVHGSLFIQQELIMLLIQAGCRMAEPGEFTRRAFINRRFDLSQAEAVADLIAAESKAAHDVALNQMRGGFSDALATLREQLLQLTTLLELELDFSEEDVEFANRAQLTDIANSIHTHIERLTQSFTMGNVIKNGVPVAIVGSTNAGKSTLLNRLLNEERALVSDIHGTTRDTIEDTVTLQGTQYRFIDTAGLRDTSDTIENLGIERSIVAMSKAQLILWVLDANDVLDEKVAEMVVEHADNKQLIVVLNKCDKLTDEQIERAKQWLDTHHCEAVTVAISAKMNINCDALINLICSHFSSQNVGNNDVIVTNLRHYEALTHADAAIVRALEGLSTNLPGDLLAQDIRECLYYLGLITGQVSENEILGRIFSKFCIGK